MLSPWTIAVLACAIALAALARVGWRYRANPGGDAFTFIAACAAAYAFGYVGQLTATTLPGKFLWLKLQYPPVFAVSFGLLAFALDYTGKREWLTRRRLAALCVVPVAAFAVAWTDPGNGAFFSGVRLGTLGGRPDIEYGFTALGTAAWVYQYAVAFGAVAVIAGLARHPNRAYRRQGRVLLVATLLPLAAGAVTIFTDLSRVDPTPLALLLTVGLLGWGVANTSLLDVVPVDRRETLEQVRDPVTVVDASNRIIDANGAARDVFDAARLTGTSLDDHLDALGLPGLDALTDGDVVATADDPPRHFEVGRDPVTVAGDVRGRVFTLHDVTDHQRLRAQLERQREQLAVLNRLLRHDIRNDATVIAGWADLLAAEDDEHAEAVDRIRSAADDITTLTSEVETLETMITDSGDTALRPVDVGAVLDKELSKVATAHPEARLDRPSVPDGVRVRANDLLGSVVRNLVQNAVVHSDRDEPRVDVAVDVDDSADEVVVTVSDDGPGIDDPGRVLEAGVSGAASDGTGMGLSLVATLVEEFGGTLTIEENDPRGTRVVVRLPRA